MSADRHCTTRTGKEAAAREAAARFATDATRAVELYAALTGRSKQWAGKGQEALTEEMLSLLPAYRHPVHDASTEYILFIDPGGLPPAPERSNNAVFPAVSLDEEWLRAEWAQCLAELARMEAEIAEMGGRDGQERPQGVTDPSGRGVTVGCFRQQMAYRTYIRLVRSKGFSRRQAVDAVAILFGFPSFAAALQTLRVQQKEVIRRWQQSAPCLMETILARWRGLLPGE